MALMTPNLVSVIETPQYAVLDSLIESVEVRQYSEFTLARVNAIDLGSDSDNRFFRTFADYIFA